MLNNMVYLTGEAVFMSDIGPQPPEYHSDTGSTLVCATIGVSNACCKGSTNKTNDRAG